MSMSRRHRTDNHRFSSKADTDSAVIMDTSIGSDGERSDNDYDAEDITPSTTPVSETGKSANGKRNEFVFKLKFSIDNILKPEFGKQAGNGIRGGASDTSGSPPTFGTTPSPLASPRSISAGQHGIGSRNSTSDSLLSTINAANHGNQVAPAAPPATPSLWPAWVYCTRYSDRPSSGKRK